MKVAILGAGVAGLSCAITLKKYGITPVIIEKRHFSGEPYTHVGALLQIITRPIKDPFDYLNNGLGITFSPISLCKKITMHGPATSSTLSGNLGAFVIKGREPQSVNNQLLAAYDGNVKFDTHAEIEELEQEYDFVVVATGTADITKRLGCWQNIYETWVHGATVLGNFDPHHMEMWLNTNYCKNGYAYLTPFDHKRATLVLIIEETTRTEMQYFWDLFISREKLNYPIVDTFEQPHEAGHCFPHRVRNIYFAGNAGGFMEPFLGFAYFSAVVSGVEAARSIATGSDYEQGIKQIAEDSKRMIALRKVLNQMENQDYDRVVAAIGLPGVNTFVYNSNISFIDYLSKLVNAYLRLQNKAGPSL